MIKFFYKKVPLDTPVVKDGRLRYIRDRATSELNNIKEYYHNRNSKVKNSNMLVSLITTLAPNYDIEIWEYVRLLESNVIYNSKTFGIVSNYNKGYVNNNVLFRSNSKELFILKDTDIDLMEADVMWKKYSALHIIRHDDTDLRYKIPSEDVDLKEETLTVIEIDLIKLLVQYKYWALERLSNGFDSDPAYFVYRYVFTNTMEDFMDLAIINRANMLLNNKEIPLSIYKHPFNVLDFDSRMNDILIKVLKGIKDSNKSYAEIFKNIPLLFTDNVYDYMLTNNMLYNRQSMWAAWIGRLQYINLMVDISGKRTFSKNNNIIEDIKIFLKRVSREDDFGSKLGCSLGMEYDLNIEIINTVIGER